MSIVGGLILASVAVAAVVVIAKTYPTPWLASVLLSTGTVGGITLLAADRNNWSAHQVFSGFVVAAGITALSAISVYNLFIHSRRR